MSNVEERIEKDIKELADNKIVSWYLIKKFRESSYEIRALIISLIIKRVFRGSSLLYGVISLVFKDEIKSLIELGKKITKESLLKFVEIIERFKKRKKK